MHTDLSPHLHTPQCNELIALYHKCHKDNPFKKYFGVCNEIDDLVWKCCKKERLERKALNAEKAKSMREKIYRQKPAE